MNATDPKVDRFIERSTRWKAEMRALRDVLLDCDLAETLKWGKPCYTAHGGNIVILQPFKAHLSLMFFKGALLDDPEGILRSQGEHSQASRRVELTAARQVRERSPILRSYIREAIAIEEAGLEVPKKRVADYEVPAELEKRLLEDEAYRKAFQALTPGRKKSYLLHFSAARRPSTRERRIENCRARILQGRGFHER
ncbi:MAG: YdeI/OmpD-associated family protein [Candidatus Palauibacterales bacterium]|nr:YdeI/OmpD-associated family protein [Candidatus Palauibacterales bacterium]